jgi:hypothetical protein
VFDLAEEPLDQIALTIDAPVYRTVYQALAGRGDMSFGSAGSDQVEQRIGVISAIGDDVTAFEAGEQEWCRAQVVVLSGGQHQAHWQAVLIDQSVYLGA